MDFEQYLLEQIQMHPAVQPQDIWKLCYQAAFGPEHLLSDLQGAKAYLEKEYEITAEQDIPLYEPISEEICRVNLAAWKFHGLPVEWLFRIFASSCGKRADGEVLFRAYLQRAEEVLSGVSVGFSCEDWKAYARSRREAGLSPVHHSPLYRQRETPAYRIVNRRFVRLFPILQKAAEKIAEDKVWVIAIDGRAASGKTTMANLLQEILEADVIRMDDFFLPPALRREERFRKAGGNVHYERFRAEVLPHLSLPTAFAYRIFDCSRMDYHGEREIGTAKIRIVEGSYSCHPLFGKYADLTVFSDVSGEIQMQRICKRNGAEMAQLFRDRWIPLEEAYFQAYQIAEKADIRL